MPLKYRDLMGTLWNITERGLLNMYFTFMLMGGLKEWKITCYAILFLSSCSVIGIILFIPESPKWLYAKERYIELRNVLLDLAKKNGTTVSEHSEIIRLADFEEI
jgi:hypothetical protein